MNIIKGKCSDCFDSFTVPIVTLQDIRLSNHARGLLIYLISLPEDYTIDKKNLSKTLRINLKTLQKQINELKKYKYCIYKKYKNSAHFSGGEYCIYPVPFDQLEDSGISFTKNQLKLKPESLITEKLTSFANVYLMKNMRNKYIKIGFTKDNPTFREKTLQSEEPEIELIKHWKGTFQDEQNLHQLFHKKRVRGEWFKLSEKDIKRIEKYFSD